MRILQVIGTLAPSYGGPAIATPELCTALAERGHEVELFSTDYGGQRVTSEVRGSARAAYRLTSFPVRFPKVYGTSPTMATALWNRAQDFDVMHVHSVYGFHTLASAYTCRVKGIPYVISPHGALDQYHWRQRRWKKAPYEWLVERGNLNSAQILHATSEREKAFLQLLALKSPIRVVPQGVSRPESLDGYKDEAGAARRTPFIVSIGRLAAKKRLDILVDAFSIVAATRRNIRLVIAGPEEGAVGTDLRRQVADLGLGERVEFTGAVYGDAKWRLLAAASALVLPSEDESFGVAVAEAMAAGVPVVVSRGVSLHNLIEQEGAGLVTDASVISVADAIAELVDNPERGTSLGSRGLDVAMAEFTWRAVARKTEEMLLDAMR